MNPTKLETLCTIDDTTIYFDLSTNTFTFTDCQTDVSTTDLTYDEIEFNDEDNRQILDQAIRDCETNISLLIPGFNSAGKAEFNGIRLDSPATDQPIKPADQVGGTHYSDRGIQPIEYINTNNLGYHEGNVIKYTTRHRYKNGKQDIEKAIWYLRDLLANYDQLTKDN